MRQTVACWVLCLTLMAPSLAAEVSHVEIETRREIADGQAFGESGPYEELVGRIHFLIDPRHPRNQVITDLDLAPLNGDGMVEMSADLSILTPVNPGRGNGVALMEIVNRGRRVVSGFNRAGRGNPFGDGFLMNRGYTIVSVGWEFDVPPSPTAVRIDVPSAQGLFNSPIGGLGFVAVRDTAAWIKHSSDSIVSTDYAITFGSSQSGRFLRNYLYLGFNTDESGRKVFDGVIPHIAGSSRIDLNRRGAEPVSPGQYTATSFPFADQAFLDPVDDGGRGNSGEPERPGESAAHLSYQHQRRILGRRSRRRYGSHHTRRRRRHHVTRQRPVLPARGHTTWARCVSTPASGQRSTDGQSHRLLVEHARASGGHGGVGSR